MVVDPMMAQPNPLERYKILRELGRGAIGTVYAARDDAMGAVVALKTLNPALFSDADANLSALFLKNARSAGRLRHRNIVQVHDAGEAGGTAYVATELLEGESLRNTLDQRPLSIARAIQIFDDIASALAYAHEEGMVHRGVRPSNIMVLRSGVAKITDFGIGQIGEAALRYLSPEQVRGDPVDHRSDLFSLGAVFYEMLTRRAPFEGNSPKEIKENILRAEPTRPSEVNPHVPGALDGIVLRMLAGHPDVRFANARILLRDLQRVEEALGLGPGASAGEPAASVPPGGPEPRLRTPDPGRFRDREPTMHDAPRFAEHEEFRHMMGREPAPERSSGSRAAKFAALALLLAAFPTGLGVAWYYSPSRSEPPAPASRMQEAPAPVTVAAKEPATAPAAPEASPPRPLGDARAESPLPPKPLVAEPTPPAQTESLPARESKPTAQPTASVSEPQPGGTAKLMIAVAPQGELYIDGKHYGATPPITTLDLEPGMHRIEIRSGSRKPYLTYITVQAGDLRRIRHDFAAKPIRPPG
jgi:eukaryotic-like serine/threonine-protein kinase